ncbi:hypothetical protein KC842_00910 [Candidatus Nomurabacteria bacterium]|nr:hypothetical protein [Candidatus Nomurabacteria bacterium]
MKNIIVLLILVCTSIVHTTAFTQVENNETNKDFAERLKRGLPEKPKKLSQNEAIDIILGVKTSKLDTTITNVRAVFLPTWSDDTTITKYEYKSVGWVITQDERSTKKDSPIFWRIVKSSIVILLFFLIIEITAVFYVIPKKASTEDMSLRRIRWNDQYPSNSYWLTGIILAIVLCLITFGKGYYREFESLAATLLCIFFIVFLYAFILNIFYDIIKIFRKKYYKKKAEELSFREID